MVVLSQMDVPLIHHDDDDDDDWIVSFIFILHSFTEFSCPLDPLIDAWLTFI